MRRILLALVCLAVTGCTESKRRAVEDDLSKRLSPGCYTVDLFDPYKIEYPAADVPVEMRKFLGVWKNGAWGDNWCHDLYITSIKADGTAEVLDAYGPNSNRGYEATVFKRRGRIENGVLTFQSRGRSEVHYSLVGDYLVGKRRDKFGTIEITMSRDVGLALVPIPPRKPVRRS